MTETYKKSTPLTDILPAKARKYVYAAYTLAVTVVGILAAIPSVNVPEWVFTALTLVGGLLGATAASNVRHTPPVE